VSVPKVAKTFFERMGGLRALYIINIWSREKIDEGGGKRVECL
jgi:hypothetical protein